VRTFQPGSACIASLLGLGVPHRTLQYRRLARFERDSDSCRWVSTASGIPHTNNGCLSSEFLGSGCDCHTLPCESFYHAEPILADFDIAARPSFCMRSHPGNCCPVYPTCVSWSRNDPAPTCLPPRCIMPKNYFLARLSGQPKAQDKLFIIL